MAVSESKREGPDFVHAINLADERLGARALYANDEFFAEKENLVKPGRGIFIPDKYTDRGKWMDGWETRRKRVPGYDWCILRLGLGGRIRGVDVDTNFFLGNHPPEASLEALSRDGLDDDSLISAKWQEIVPRSKLAPGSQNFFAVTFPERVTHVRLNIFPDGGVARLKVYGDVMPDLAALRREPEIDLLAVSSGGKVVGCNDMFFSSKDNLIMPGRGVNMGDGWETRRKRVPGHDFAVLRLGHAGTIRKFLVDTRHFKGNYPDRCSIDACHAPTASDADVLKSDWKWNNILPESKLQADFEHHFDRLTARGPFTHVRLNIFPDGGVSRLRAFGALSE